MPKVHVLDFKYGMDRRRKRAVGTPGSLWTLKNAHITRGGDIERMKKWVKLADLPANTFGLETRFGQLVVFGSDDVEAQMPLTVAYQRLTPPAGTAMAQILDTTTFDNKLYAIARFDDGSINHYYDGVRLTSWDAIAAGTVNPAWLVYELGVLCGANPAIFAVASGRVLRFTALQPGVDFTLTATGAGATLTVRQPNVAPVAEVAAIGTIEIVSGPFSNTGPSIKSVRVGNYEMLTDPIPWNGSATDMALEMTVAINQNAGYTGYRATVNGTIIALTAGEGKGASVNGQPIVVTTDPGIDIHTTPINGGVSEVLPVAKVVDVNFPGAITAATQLVATINGTVYKSMGSATNMGTSIFPYKQRVWSTAGTLLRYCKLNDPSNWSDATAGFINMPNEGDGTERLIALARYNDAVAVFSTGQIRIWTLDIDPLKNASGQLLANTGALSVQSVVQYGDQDVFYYDNPGIRSLKARAAVTTAAVNDVGTAIDTWLDAVERLGERADIQNAAGIIEPLDGRYILALGNKMIVLSFFGGSKISAWSYYEPGFKATHFARVGHRLYARDANAIYIYGGLDGDVYPDDNEFPVEVETPFVTANDAAQFKQFQAFMACCENEWDVKVLMDPNDEEKTVWAGIVHGYTYVEDFTPVEGMANAVALKMTCSRGGPASFSSFAFDFEKVG